MPPSPDQRAALLASLFIEALRRGEPSWFQVSSGSMRPLLRVGDCVRVEPTQAGTLRPGEIAAFETPQGLTVHRLLLSTYEYGTLRLLQMGDAGPVWSWLDPQQVVGRVVAVQRGSRELNLRLPIARWWGNLAAYARYQYYLKRTSSLTGTFARRCSRGIVRLAAWSSWLLCATSAQVHT